MRANCRHATHRHRRVGHYRKRLGANLHGDGLQVRNWNRSPKDFPFCEPDLVKSVTGAELILIVVADPPAVESLLEVIAPHLKTGRLVAQASAISAADEEICRPSGTPSAAFLEAPSQAANQLRRRATPSFYLGGTTETVELARPFLQRLAAHLLHIGPTGTASSLKLAMNLNPGGNREALSESRTLARAEGISDETYLSSRILGN